MATRFSFKLDGIEKYQKNLDAAPKTLVKLLDAEFLATGQKIARDAKSTVQNNVSDTGFLASKISAFQFGPLVVRVVAQANYAAYVEFGTGGLVKVPDGLEEYAMQFKGAGIREVNLKARPFLFPAFLKNRAELIKNVKNILADFE